MTSPADNARYGYAHRPLRGRTLSLGLVFALFLTLSSSAASADGSGSADGEMMRVIARLAIPESIASTGPVARRRSVREAAQRVQSALRRGRHRVRRTYAALPYVALEVDAEGLATLERSPFVAAIRPDVPHRLALHGSTEQIGAPRAWELGMEGQGSTVAILDTGIDSTHPFLAGRVIAEACFSSGDCPNGGDVQFGPGAAAPCRFAEKACGHGTHVAGIVAGRGPDFQGVAPGASIIAIQVFSKSNKCAEGEAKPCARTYTSDYLAALEWLHESRADFPNLVAANLSFSAGRFESPRACDGENPDIARVVADLRSDGVVTVVASGNEGHPDGLGSPACISGAIAVASATSRGRFSSFSNRSPYLAFAAPGSFIWSSIPGSFRSMSGTSMAAPHVAGALALLRQAEPNLPPAEMLITLEITGAPVVDDAGGFAVAAIDVGRAVDFQSGVCGCRDDVDNFCAYPQSACRMTHPGGYCDPNGDGDFSDGDWDRGFAEFQRSCVAAPERPARQSVRRSVRYDEARAARVAAQRIRRR